MLRIRTLTAGVVVFALLAGCSRTAAPPAGDPSDPPPSTAADGDLAEARRTWQAQQPAFYAYDLEISCFCIHRGEYAVQVRGGEITSVRAAGDGAAVRPEVRERIVTPDQLFEAIDDAERAGTHTRVTYDPRMGYPAEAEIGLLADDSGTLYRIENLRAT